MIYYTSDLHLGHKNITKYENRPFKSVEEMDAALIKNWNNTVTKDDDIYVLGDFCFKGATKTIKYLERLHGRIHLLRGNHDYFMSQQYYKDWLYQMQLALEVKHRTPIFHESYYKHIKDNEHEVILCHYPILHWENMERGSIHLYGHVHTYRDCSAMAPNSYNVGVDVNNYKPVTLEQLLNRTNL